MEPTETILKRDIIAILENADLSKLSSKKVRLQLSEKYDCDLQHRKDEIDRILMDEITNQQNSKSASSKSKAETSKSPVSAKTKKSSVSMQSSNGKLSSDDDSDMDVKKEIEAESDSDDQLLNDEDLARKLQQEETRRTRHSKSTKNPIKKEKTKKQKGDGPKRPNKYMEACNLSPALSAVVGQDQLPRHEVVKRMWAIIKERNLLDPKNKQFMLCDDQFMTLFGRKRVKTFGMMKYLSHHIVSPSADR